MMKSFHRVGDYIHRGDNPTIFYREHKEKYERYKLDICEKKLQVAKLYHERLNGGLIHEYFLNSFILNFEDIQEKFDTTMLFISHDLSVVRYVADRVVVMYLGKISEAGTTEEIFSPPYHPYTEALLSAVPIADPDIQKRQILLEGALPSPLNPPSGCVFHTRCPDAILGKCDKFDPPVQNHKNGHQITCHIPIKELAKKSSVFAIKK